MTKPIIGVAPGTLAVDSEMFPGRQRDYVNQVYLRSITDNGGMPLILPVTQDKETIERYVGLIDGLLLCGGQDVDPLTYGEEPLEKLGGIDPKRDAYEIALIKAVHAAHKPILGICRGIQILNACYGGTIYQDLSYMPAGQGTIKHLQAQLPAYGMHHVTVTAESKLAHFLGQTKLAVNSFHHQALHKIAPGFRVVATAPDDVVEAIEADAGGLRLAVQWHPEEMQQVTPVMARLFAKFIAETNQIKD
ncbi:gamma-glutamyl-gamma-aminobutyrate hydrolase family protein [Lactiplantibacillus sp. WILCCON 0030]|uniref:Gamma-glutamyl-gamma-aminobutyrate hydrolase family protein n=1 Tax=Lactiplantibacillus brownii TaxID=3069269 RepID=A0ABU1A530_9LACO|nr:gamma-glutamyl-gamma-aminobutyrate hydrolase family protein [Lactiplantibacillus brownii]MDQ7936103.1 gamma-glutamyl-gamma-aminobutyrate hydrolase family protein [Lactiplantibacillus brownii]